MRVTSMKLLNKPDILTQAFCTVEVEGIEIRDLTIIKGKHGNFVSLPSKQYEQDGERKYRPYVRFTDEDQYKLLCRVVLDAYYEHLKMENRAPDGTQVEEAERPKPQSRRASEAPHSEIKQEIQQDTDWFSQNWGEGNW